MFKIRQLALLTFASLALAISVGATGAQPDGTRTGKWGWGQGMMGPGMMLGPGMMGRGGFGGMCNPAAAGFIGWRIDRLEQLIKPTDAQRSRFDELKEASNKATEIMRSACPVEVPTTAISRMEAMEKRMDAMLQSIRIVRPALEAFYATLSDEQKVRFDTAPERGRFWHHLR